ncbi:hypothetical protein ACFQO7_31985 [Catellatospora aurea]|uniref:Uncharacterized protein n=1 Tax=Catellatospora aurea TaxID=1337874 RepID=A0ABW2H744_9ACTN
MSPRLVRGVLAVYPRSIRERYGDEVADMLVHSPRPARDLADVAWCALSDRLSQRPETMTMAEARSRTFTLATIMAAPVVFGAALLVALSAVIMVFNNVDPGAGYQTVAIASAAMLVPVALLALWWGRRMGRTRLIAAPGLVVPLALAAAVTLVWTVPSIPMAGESLGESLLATIPATATWCLGLMGLITVRAKLREGGRLMAVLVTAFGGLMVLELSTIANVLSVLDAHAAPRKDALWWYPATISGYDPGLVFGTNDMLHDAVGVLPAVLTLCTVFSLSLIDAADWAGNRAPDVAFAQNPV